MIWFMMRHPAMRQRKAKMNPLTMASEYSLLSPMSVMVLSWGCAVLWCVGIYICVSGDV